MNKKWILVLMSSLMAAMFAVGCNVNDEPPPPENDMDNGYENEETVPQDELPPLDEETEREQELEMEEDMQNEDNLDQDMMENENQ
ncbi:hypothetical protein [Bacillus kexueae]|uniref:hypothetical protein n=1 Tax=Aeribacillus kexueae TaxID=2078952 RepID=UPI001FAE9FFB|nr:hypothetical protein [Bacillus kexueae]